MNRGETRFVMQRYFPEEFMRLVMLLALGVGLPCCATPSARSEFTIYVSAGATEKENTKGQLFVYRFFGGLLVTLSTETQMVGGAENSILF